jgi:hypothetical protein
MKKTVIILIACIMLLSAAHAETYTYFCRLPGTHKSSPLKLDTERATLAWHGLTFKNLTDDAQQFRDPRPFDGCKAEFQATRGVVTADVCSATKGGATLTVGGAGFDCQMK